MLPIFRLSGALNTGAVVRTGLLKIAARKFSEWSVKKFRLFDPRASGDPGGGQGERSSRVNSTVRAPEFGSRGCPGIHTSDLKKAFGGLKHGEYLKFSPKPILPFRLFRIKRNAHIMPI